MGVPRVLVVDDSAVAARQLTRILEESGRYRVIGHAADGVSALKLFAVEAPDLVCLDVVMPHLDGIQTLRLMRRARPNATVVIISSVVGEADKMVECLRAGARTAVTKPYDPDRVLEVLDSVWETT